MCMSSEISLKKKLVPSCLIYSLIPETQVLLFPFDIGFEWLVWGQDDNKFVSISENVPEYSIHNSQSIVFALCHSQHRLESY